MRDARVGGQSQHGRAGGALRAAAVVGVPRESSSSASSAPAAFASISAGIELYRLFEWIFGSSTSGVGRRTPEVTRLMAPADRRAVRERVVDEPADDGPPVGRLAPDHRVPAGESAALQATAGRVSYGWGMLPVTARINGTTWTTSLWPKDQRHVVPLKDAVRRAEAVEAGDTVTIRLSVDA